MTDPIRTLGVNYVLLDQTVMNTALIKQEIRAVSPRTTLADADVVAQVPWGPHRLVLFRLPAAPA
jgi:hypothetical protein